MLNVVDIKKVVLSVMITVMITGLIMLLWRMQLVLIVALIALAYLKHILLPIKKELPWYTTIGLFGPILEIIIIYTGVWYYAQNSLIHVPLWCPFAWGIAGTTVISLYSGIVNKKSAGRNNAKKTKHHRKNKFKT